MSSTATATRPTVTVACKGCGSSFERPVGRGRPQVWCPPCREVPFYERATVPTAQAQSAPVPAEQVPAIVVSAAQAHRDDVEARVQAVYAWWKGADGWRKLTSGKNALTGFEAHTVLAEKLRECGSLGYDSKGNKVETDEDNEV